MKRAGQPAGHAIVSATEVVVYDEDGDGLAVIPAELALTLLDEVEKQREALAQSVAQKTWALTFRRITDTVAQAGVPTPRSVEIDAGYDGVDATVRFREVEDVLALAAAINEPVSARLRWPGVEDYQDTVMFAVVADGVEYSAYETDAQLAAALNDRESVTA